MTDEALAPLAVPGDLVGLPGAPFTEGIVTAAGASIRAEAGWHIAPVRTDTLVVDTYGGNLLALPTLRLLNVVSVHDVTDPDNPIELTGWRKSKNGLVWRAVGWPVGFERVSAVIEHGYETCPAELLPLVAERSQRRVSQESLGSRSVSYASDGSDVFDAVLGLYTIPGRP